MSWFADGYKLQREKLMLEEEVKRLKNEKADLELKKRIEVEEIKHMNRLAQEKRDIELEREKVKVGVEYNTKLEKMEKANRDVLLDKLEAYHKATQEDLRGFNRDMKDTTLSIYKDIIARLPKVNVNMER